MRKNNHILRHIAAFGILTMLSVPATSSASVPGETTPTAMDADPDCESSTVELEIDVATGYVYLVDPSTGNMALTDGDITVAFGSLGDVLIKLHYSSSDWNVVVTADGGSPIAYTTTNGWLRYSISSEVEEYVFSSTEVPSGASASAMVNMVPVLPDIIIRPLPNCPPPP